MPRTSYGDIKRNQAWQLVAALMQRQGSQNVQLRRNGKGQSYLLVEASLSDMRGWSKLTIEDVRESLTKHLGKSFLGIALDNREQKAGRSATQWKFELRLWSTDLEENRQQFETAWQKARSRNSSNVGESNSQISSDNSLASPQQENGLDTLIQEVRERCRQKILNQHSRMRVLSGDEIGVDQLYVDVWLLNRLPRTFMVSPSKFLETFDLRNDRLGLGDRIQRKKGFEIANANTKLLIVGKPGAGKTTFLKHLAVDWREGKFQPDSIAVLIEFRRTRDGQGGLMYAIEKELGLDNWGQIQEIKKQISNLKQQISNLKQQISNWNQEISDLERKSPKETEQKKHLKEQEKHLKEQDIQALEQQLEPLPLQVLLKQGKLLVLMDGLDEVPTSELRDRVQSQLGEIVEDYPNNRLILTCRTQIIELIPNGFTSVEVADFSAEQIKEFVQNWFTATGKSNAEALQQWETFDHAVGKNAALKELTVTPVLLSLMCLVLQDQGEMTSQIDWLYKKGLGYC